MSKNKLSLSALFWGPWSLWSPCPNNVSCTSMSSLNNRIQRTRICQRRHYFYNSQNNQFYSTSARRQQLVPCILPNEVQIEFDECPNTNVCEDPATTTTVNNILEATTEGSIIIYKPTSTTSKPDGAQVNWKTIRACQPLMPDVDELPDGFPWEILLQFSNLPEGEKCEPGIAIQMKTCSDSTTECGDIETERQWITHDPTLAYTSEILRETHCWIDQKCPGNSKAIEPPSACAAQASWNQSTVRVNWNRTPFGLKPHAFQIRVHPSDNYTGPNSLKHYLIPLNEPSDEWGERYDVELDHLAMHTNYSVEIGSLSETGQFFSEPGCKFDVLIGVDDGGWSTWSSWSECSSTCSVHAGYRKRERWCNSPLPSSGGRDCSGPKTMKQQCFGSESLCVEHTTP